VNDTGFRPRRTAGRVFPGASAALRVVGPRRAFSSRAEGTGHVCDLGARGAYDSWGLVPHDNNVCGRVGSVFGPLRLSGLSDLVRCRTGGARMMALRAFRYTLHSGGDAAGLRRPVVEPQLSNSAEDFSVRPEPSRCTHMSLALVARHIFMGASGPKTAP
jgi:hypothetical protein